VIALLIACAGAALLALGTSLLVRIISRRHPYLATVDRRCRKPWTLTLTDALRIDDVVVVEQQWGRVTAQIPAHVPI